MKKLIGLAPIILGAVLLLGCTLSKSNTSSTPDSAQDPGGTPAALGSASGQASGGAQSGSNAQSGSSAAPTSAQANEEDAVKAVIQKANDEQQQAFARNDATLMQDTATPDYYDQLAQTQQDLQDGGVTAIKLVSLEWGTVDVRGTHATATTFETWLTTFGRGRSQQDRQRNDYTLVKQGNNWKIQADIQPDTGLEQPAPSTANPNPGSSGTTPPSARGGTGGNGAGGSASGSPGASPAPRTRTPGRLNQSSNWSGYAATGGQFTAVSGTWIVPQVTGPEVGAGDAAWVGIGGTNSRDLIQAGTEASVGAGGRVRYNAWIETLPQSARTVPLTVGAGDTVNVSLVLQDSGDWLVTLVNRTSGQQYQTTVRYNSSMSSAEWVEEAPSTGRGIVTLDGFGTVQFREASAVKDGKTMNIAQAGGVAITMIDGTGAHIAETSTLGSDGASFSVSRIGDTSPAVGTQPGSVPGGSRRTRGQ